MKGGTNVRNERISMSVNSAGAEVSSVPYADVMVAGVVNVDGEPCGLEKPDEILERIEAVGVTPPSIESILCFIPTLGLILQAEK